MVVLLVTGGCLTSVKVATLGSFSSTDGRFSVTVPGGAMTETTFDGSGPFAGSTIHAFSTTPEGGPRCAVLSGDAGADYIARTPLDGMYAAAEAGNVSSTGGTQTAEDVVEVAGLPGREQRVTADAKSYVFRLVMVGNRSYVFSVTGSGRSGRWGRCDGVPRFVRADPRRLINDPSTDRSNGTDTAAAWARTLRLGR